MRTPAYLCLLLTCMLISCTPTQEKHEIDYLYQKKSVKLIVMRQESQFQLKVMRLSGSIPNGG